MSEYDRTLHETGNCDWRCLYCAQDKDETIEELIGLVRSAFNFCPSFIKERMEKYIEFDTVQGEHGDD